MKPRTAVLATLLGLLAACGSGSTDEQYSAGASEDYAADAAADAAADTAADAAAVATDEAAADAAAVAVDNADASDVSADEVEQPEFTNCTQDCSGHEAGFEWARDKDISDPSGCGGNSQSFIEGCEAFAEERQAEAEQQAAESATEDGEAFEE